MRTSIQLIGICCAGAFMGCGTESYSIQTATNPTIDWISNAGIQHATYVTRDASDGETPHAQSPDSVVVGGAPSGEWELADLLAVTLDRNPELAEVSWAIERARGSALQAGLYPNPDLSVTGGELGDRTGATGIWSIFTGQELVTANKLGLSQAAACKEVDQATLAAVARRYEVLTRVRRAYFAALTLQRRAQILTELVKLAEQSVENAQKLRRAKEVADLDVVQLEVDMERYRADLAATQRALPAAYEKVAATVGVQEMPIAKLEGDLGGSAPIYDLDQVRDYMLGIHPDVTSAQIGVERARLVLRRAEVEPIPNVTIGAGYTRQGQNQSNDWDFGVSIPIPTWNRNQGAITAARAQVSESVKQVERVENQLIDRLADAFVEYGAAKEQSERYARSILPKAQQTYELSRKAYQGGQFEYLRVLEAQRTVAEANLELVRSQGELWDAASQIAGLMLEDDWPSDAAPTPTDRNEP